MIGLVALDTDLDIHTVAQGEMVGDWCSLDTVCVLAWEVEEEIHEASECGNDNSHRHHRNPQFGASKNTMPIVDLDDLRFDRKKRLGDDQRVDAWYFGAFHVLAVGDIDLVVAGSQTKGDGHFGWHS